MAEMITRWEQESECESYGVYYTGASRTLLLFRVGCSFLTQFPGWVLDK